MLNYSFHFLLTNVFVSLFCSFVLYDIANDKNTNLLSPVCIGDRRRAQNGIKGVDTRCPPKRVPDFPEVKDCRIVSGLYFSPNNVVLVKYISKNANRESTDKNYTNLKLCISGIS